MVSAIVNAQKRTVISTEEEAGQWPERSGETSNISPVGEGGAEPNVFTLEQP